jgi:glycosyltransferase involved in cell wall biosynthesis
MNTLYLCYFSLLEPLVQTQVLPYLRELSKSGISVDLLTFEPGLPKNRPDPERKRWEQCLELEGIIWHSLPYHSRPSLPATLYDIFVGSLFIIKMIRRNKIDVLHARAHIPMAMAFPAKWLTNCRVIFDIRGLMADEYADAGIWKAGSAVFRVIKRLERIGIRHSDQVVVLTESLRTWIIEHGWAERDKVEVIPCCTDLSRFFAESAQEDCEVKRSKRFEVIYSGSVTGLYLIEEMGKFFLALRVRHPEAFFRILTNSSHDEAARRLRQLGLTDNDFWIGAVKPSEVPSYLHAAHVGISFRKQTFSQLAASPTKIPEYLSAGLPVVANAGIGDSDEILRSDRVGVVIKDFSPESFANAVQELEALLFDDGLLTRCRESARRHFDLKMVGGLRYCNVYTKLNGSHSRPQ